MICRFNNYKIFKIINLKILFKSTINYKLFYIINFKLSFFYLEKIFVYLLNKINNKFINVKIFSFKDLSAQSLFD